VSKSLAGVEKKAASYTYDADNHPSDEVAAERVRLGGEQTAAFALALNGRRKWPLLSR
jgi:hypothetical protein